MRAESSLKNAVRFPSGIDGTLLEPAFFQRRTLTVARDLLGKYFTHAIGNTLLGGYIVEVEAYHQNGDEAAHTFGGRTDRNAVMFEAGGRLYVYFTYGMHHCMNVVTERSGIGAAVLIRAIEPVQGLDFMHARRKNPARLRDLTNGPAKCCQALAIGREHNGLRIGDTDIRIYDAPPIAAKRVERSTRIGITKSASLEWRFSVRENAFLSRKPGTNRLHNQ